MSSTSSAIITPIMMYMFSVRPPAQRGPRMVASPPTERRTPWLNPAGESATTSQTETSFRMFARVRGAWVSGSGPGGSAPHLVFSQQ